MQSHFIIQESYCHVIGFGGGIIVCMIFAFLLANEANPFLILLAVPLLIFKILVSLWFFNKHIYLWVRENYTIAYNFIFFQRNSRTERTEIDSLQ
jgi:hypothetical protein